MPSQKNIYQMIITYGYKRRTRMVYRKTFDTYERLREWQHLNDLIEERSAGQIPCRQAPDLYFPELGDGMAASIAKMAKKACLNCDVINECRTYAIKHKEEYGIWGGTTYTDRKEIWSKKK
jgi:WhiB family redox-sensing transcriptional regulator